MSVPSTHAIASMAHAAAGQRPRRSALIVGLLARGGKTLAWWGFGLGLAVAIWAAFLELSDTAPYHAASPWVAWEGMVDNGALLIDAIGVTALETAVGLVVSITLACALAFAFVVSRPTEQALMPLALVFRSIPVVAIAPLLVLVIGRGLPTAVVCVTLVTFFPVLVNLSRGLRAASPELLELFHVHGASTAQVMRMVRVPSAAPFLFAGLRVAAAKGILGAMLAEWLTGSEGLGHLLVYASGRRDIGLLWATMAIATVGAIMIFRLTAWAERAVHRRLPVANLEPA